MSPWHKEQHERLEKSMPRHMKAVITYQLYFHQMFQMKLTKVQFKKLNFTHSYCVI